MTDTPAAPPADPWAMTTEQIYSMTPEQAGAALKAMDAAIHPPPSVVPQDAQDARQQLDLLSRNASWADSLFKGNVETRKQFDELVAKAAGGDDVADAVVGIVEPTTPLFETTANGELPRRHVEGTIAGLRDSGLNDESISQAVNLPPISRAEFMQAQALKSQLHGTAEWRSKLLSGDYEATRQHNLLSVLLSSPIAEE
jgi:hypothetical protein